MTRSLSLSILACLLISACAAEEDSLDTSFYQEAAVKSATIHPRFATPRSDPSTFVNTTMLLSLLYPDDGKMRVATSIPLDSPPYEGYLGFTGDLDAAAGPALWLELDLDRASRRFFPDGNALILETLLRLEGDDPASCHSSSMSVSLALTNDPNFDPTGYEVMDLDDPADQAYMAANFIDGASGDLYDATGALVVLSVLGICAGDDLDRSVATTAAVATRLFDPQ